MEEELAVSVKAAVVSRGGGAWDQMILDGLRLRT